MANELAVIYENLTGFRVGWADLDLLPTHMRYLGVWVLHQQPPGPDPNQISVFAHDMVYFYGAPQGLTMGLKDFSPVDHREFWFDGPSALQEANIDIEPQAQDFRVSGAKISLTTFPIAEPDYETRRDQAVLIDRLTLPLLT